MKAPLELATLLVIAPVLSLLAAEEASSISDKTADLKVNALSQEETARGFVSLFDGVSFEGWEQNSNWEIQEGAFARVRSGGSLTYTADKVPDDFEVRFEWKVSKGCNSGVYYRPGQVEYQVLDNIGSPYGENPRQAAASLFFCMAPSKDVTRSPGEWQEGRIVCKGSLIQHWLNGVKVIDFDYTDPKWIEEMELLHIRGGDLTGRNGNLWLQDHGAPVWFRKIRWREIPAEESLLPDLNFQPMPIPASALEKERARVHRMLKQAKPKILPAGWDPALAGDQVMKRLVNISAPHIKGAHDAEFVCVGDRAYVVSEANDKQPGESAGWPFIYATLSIVNLKTLSVEKVIDFSKGEQQFENDTLPTGACFVPRILQKDASTLRCYFTSEDPGKRQSQLWYRDFDLNSNEFNHTIHKAKLKTAAGTFDFQPQYFHADAAAQGFEKPAVDSSFFLFDSFKKFDDQLYVALNNFTGKQNGLARVHDDLATFEVIGHYNEPQSEQLSESAINRLPDGTWMAVCRNDRGNYHFTTSKEGKNWNIGKELYIIPDGANSKPTFDKFGELYYLGWQENTRIRGVNRSVFNIDVSSDGKTWERKYRFETPKSFQYPTFHEHEGAIWLNVTQGDTSSSRKERIMFGKLEDLGQFESQSEQQRIEWPKPPVIPAVMQRGVKLFTDRNYVINELPEEVLKLPFLRTSIEKIDVVVIKPGTLFALTPTIRPKAASQEDALQNAGFTKVETPEVQLFPGKINRVSLYRKQVTRGERLRFRKLVVLITGPDVELSIHNPKAAIEGPDK